MRLRDISAGLAARAALAACGFSESRPLGQNFLLDDALVGQLVALAGVARGDCVLEIGPGAGVMTQHMLACGARVLAVELDRDLAPVLRSVLAEFDAVRVLYEDALRVDLAGAAREAFAGAPYRVVANLPYYITTEILLKLLTMRDKPQSIVVMVQREAWERLSAAPGDKRWCALAATAAYYARMELLCILPPTAFTPAPRVESAFIRLDLSHGPAVRAADEAMLLRLISAAFAMRRKTLANNMAAAFAMPRARAEALLESCGLAPKVRGEALSVDQLVRLSDAMQGA